jgi:YHS domain-containing protein
MKRLFLLVSFAFALTIGLVGEASLADSNTPANSETTVTEAATPQAPRPEDCLLAGPNGAATSVEYGGKTYYLRSQACKEEFLTDPERYSQLYDALSELKAQGKTTRRPAASDASLVPS